MLTLRGRSMFAREGSCCARWRRSCSQDPAVAVSDADGTMPGLRSCLASGRRDHRRRPRQRHAGRQYGGFSKRSKTGDDDMGVKVPDEILRKHFGSLCGCLISVATTELASTRSTGRRLRHVSATFNSSPPQRQRRQDGWTSAPKQAGEGLLRQRPKVSAERCEFVLHQRRWFSWTSAMLRHSLAPSDWWRRRKQGELSSEIARVINTVAQHV